MEIRFHFDPDTGPPHIYGHGVTEDEAEFILRHAGQDRKGRDGSRRALGSDRGGLISAYHLSSR